MATDWDPRVRRIIYWIFTVWALANGAAHAYALATGDVLPGWFIGQVAVFGALATATGILAATNTPSTRAGQDAQHEVDAIGPAECGPFVAGFVRPLPPEGGRTSGLWTTGYTNRAGDGGE